VDDCHRPEDDKRLPTPIEEVFQFAIGKPINTAESVFASPNTESYPALHELSFREQDGPHRATSA
jgi:hypothetical protein